MVTNHQNLEYEAGWSIELNERLQRLQDQALTFTWLCLIVLGVIVLRSPGDLLMPEQSIGLSLALFALIGCVLWLRRWGYAVAAWFVVGGIIACLLLIIIWSGYGVLACLLMLPAGLATLLLSIPAGLATAFGFSLLLLFPPYIFPIVNAEVEIIALIGIWSTVGMIGLTLHPLLRITQWAWTGYEQSHDALERARDYQQRLHESVEDLNEANVQLTHMNRLAQSLRQIAEDERRAKEQFVANVSHELRTPLNMIIGFCEMITETPETYGESIPTTLLADLEVVLRNSQHLSGLINDVLDLSQIEVGQMALTRERTALAEIVQAAITAVQPLFVSKHLSLKTEIPDDLPTLYCDHIRIREVLLNLLSNAGRFTEIGGVTIKAWCEGNNVFVSISDTGPGISVEGQKRIFQPFEQLDSTIRRRYGGTGLGLSISKGFVEAHNGEMWVKSQEGQGTTFFFRLPLELPQPSAGDFMRWFNPYHQPEQRTRPTTLQPVPLTPRWMIVEQGNAMQQLFTRYVDGVEFSSVHDLTEAVGTLSQMPVQALLINELDMHHTLERLEKEVTLPYGVPAIICSIPGIEQATNGLGVSDYLIKPISREALLSALQHLKRQIHTILVVDDEPDALKLFRRILTSAEENYRVLRASNGHQALEIMQQESPDVILLDLAMPEMDGFQFLKAREHHAAWGAIPVILISARDPFGQPIVSNALAVTTARGLSVHQIIESVKTLSAILSPPLLGTPPPVNPTADAPTPPTTYSD